MAASAVQTKRWTRRVCDRMAEAGILDPDERVQLIEGEIVTMTPQNIPHSASIGLVKPALRQIFGPTHWIRIQLPLIVDPDSEPKPDLAVVPGSARKYVKEHPRTALLIVEVARRSLWTVNGKLAFMPGPASRSTGSSLFGLAPSTSHI